MTTTNKRPSNSAAHYKPLPVRIPEAGTTADDVDAWTHICDHIPGALLEVRRQRAAVHLHGLGPRAVLCALLDAAKGGDVDAVLADYGHLTRGVVEALGGNKFPATPVFEVPGR